MAFSDVPALVLLAVGQRDQPHLAMAAGQRARQALGVQRPHGGVGDDEGVAAGRHGLERARVVQQAGADQDGVAALTQVDADLARGG
ncbi:hypothetical protein MASR1M50_23810 [Burkholderiales bacterium]